MGQKPDCSFAPTFIRGSLSSFSRTHPEFNEFGMSCFLNLYKSVVVQLGVREHSQSGRILSCLVRSSLQYLTNVPLLLVVGYSKVRPTTQLLLTTAAPWSSCHKTIYQRFFRPAELVHVRTRAIGSPLFAEFIVAFTITFATHLKVATDIKHAIYFRLSLYS